MKEEPSERPPSLRQTEFRDDGTLMTTEYDRRGRVVRQIYYWSPDQAQLMRILAGPPAKGEWVNRIQPG